jgi:HNH endonuclease
VHYGRADILALTLLDRGYLTVDAEAGAVWNPSGRAERVDKRTGYGRVQVYSRPLVCAMAHRIIWISVHGLIPPGLQINHVNRHGWDNRIANLELVSPAGNSRHGHGHRDYDACGPTGNIKTNWLDTLGPGERTAEYFDPYGRHDVLDVLDRGFAISGG